MPCLITSVVSLIQTSLEPWITWGGLRTAQSQEKCAVFISLKPHMAVSYPFYLYAFSMFSDEVEDELGQVLFLKSAQFCS